MRNLARRRPLSIEDLDARVHVRTATGLDVIVTPSMIRAYIARVDAQAVSLDADIQASAARPEFKAAWSRFYASWRAFWVDNHEAGWLTSGGIYDETEKFEREIATWRAAFVAEGGKTTAPRPPAPPQPFDWNRFMLFGTLLAAAGVGVYALSTMRKVAA